MLKTTLLAGCALACVALSGCSTLGGIAPGGNPQQFLDNLDKFNAAAAQHCTGDGNVDWNPPLPPTGSLHLRCAIGEAKTLPTAAEIQAMIDGAVSKAAAGIAAANAAAATAKP